MENAEQLASLLHTYKLEEVEAMTKATKKKASERLDAIPNQIIGLESAIVDIPVEELKARKMRLEATIQVEEKNLSEMTIENRSAINSKIVELQLQQKVLVNAANDKRTADIRTKQNEVDSISNQLAEANRAHDKYAYNTQILSDQIKRKQENLNGINADIESLKASTMPERSYCEMGIRKAIQDCKP